MARYGRSKSCEGNRNWFQSTDRIEFMLKLIVTGSYFLPFLRYYNENFRNRHFTHFSLRLETLSTATGKEEVIAWFWLQLMVK